MNDDLDPEQKKAIMVLIRGHSSNFAWKPEALTHKLNVYPEVKLVN